MHRFDRCSPPAFWDTYRDGWIEDTVGLPLEEQKKRARSKLNAGQQSNKKLSTWFHEEVRPTGHPVLCAYCDGRLEAQSPETVDHFIPVHHFWPFALCWENLYPSCSSCNSKAKGSRWSERLLRPDVDPVEKLFDVDPETGKLRPAPEIERDLLLRSQVNMTISILGLNRTALCTDRAQMFETLRLADESDDGETVVDERQVNGPYRFVVRRWLSR